MKQWVLGGVSLPSGESSYNSRGVRPAPIIGVFGPTDHCAGALFNGRLMIPIITSKQFVEDSFLFQITKHRFIYILKTILSNKCITTKYVTFMYLFRLFYKGRARCLTLFKLMCYKYRNCLK